MKFEELKSNLKIDDDLLVTDIHEDYFGPNFTECVRGITLKTSNGDYVELYDDEHWEFFKVEE